MSCEHTNVGIISTQSKKHYEGLQHIIFSALEGRRQKYELNF